MPVRTFRRPPAVEGRGVTKDLFLTAVVCPARAWWDGHDPVTPPLSRGDRFRIEEGRRVHEVARGLYPGAVRITTLHPDVAARLTADLLAAPETRVLLEPAFKVDGYVARADVLVANEGDGTVHRTTPTDADLLAWADGSRLAESPKPASTWTIIEVKSGTNPESYLNDVAYTTMVARRAGVRVGRAALLTVNPEYTRDLPLRALFVETDVSDAVDHIIEKCDSCWGPVREKLRSPVTPEARWTWACKGCPYFDTRCWGRGVDHPVFELPRIRERAWRSIVQAGAHGVRGVSDAMLDGAGIMGERWHRVRECVRTGATWKGDGLAAALGAARRPLRFLDFETVATALPLYPGVHPWEQVPTQYSVHTVTDPGILAGIRTGVDGSGRAGHGDRAGRGGRGVQGVTHSEFIASDPTRDCRRELIEGLLADLGTDDGSIVVYSNFEERILRGLAATFPDLAGDIDAVIARLVDLCDIIRDHVYHPDFHGSFSIKTVLPALVPDLHYGGSGYAIANGADAAAAFADMARGHMEIRDWDRTRRDLLEYCRLDTWAMVRLWATLS